ncbi:MAG: hypothetical protein J6S67_09685 [Methanobrevibacter sp.]|nr:hypothetical protein [Methanobrevibacter sp.]
MKMICKALGAILLIGGMIGAIIITKQLGFLSAISVYIMALVLPVILLAIAEIIENQEYIIALNKQVSPTLLGSLEKEAEEKDILSNGGWKCPKCGNVNRSYTNTCKCGAKKEEDVSISFGGWKCPKCGEMNRSHFITCKCGQKKI